MQSISTQIIQNEIVNCKNLAYRLKAELWKTKKQKH